MLLAGNLLRMLLTMVFVVYAARFLGVEGYGKFALAQHLAEFALSLSATGLGILVTREVAKDAQWLRGNLPSALMIVLALSVAAGCALALFAYLADYAADTRLAILIATLALVPGAAAMLAEAVLVALDRSDAVGIGTAVESFVRVALGFALLGLGYGLVSLLVVFVITRAAQLLLYVLLLVARMPAIHWRVSFSSLKSLARSWWTFAAENWLSTLYLNLDVVLLSLFHGEAAVGIYEAARKLIRLGSVVARCFTTAVFPVIARLYVDAQHAFHHVNVHSAKYILAAILPVALGITLAAPQIVLFVFGTEYADSNAVLQVLAWILIPQFLNPFLSHVLFARGAEQRSLMVAAIALCVFLVAALLLIPEWAALGAAFASLIASLTALGCYLVFAVAGTSGREMMAMLGRQAVAAAVLSGFVLLVKDNGVVVPLILGGLLYAVLLVLLRIVRTSDFKLLEELR
jgi:O-antigen/teichoic acid export membrane protein